MSVLRRIGYSVSQEQKAPAVPMSVMQEILLSKDADIQALVEDTASEVGVSGISVLDECEGRVEYEIAQGLGNNAEACVAHGSPNTRGMGR